MRNRQELVRGAPCYSKVEHDHKQECPEQGRSVPTPVPAFESRVLLHVAGGGCGSQLIRYQLFGPIACERRNK